MTKLLFIGGIGLGEVPTNGETAKNQVMLEKLKHMFDKVYVIDSYHWRSEPFILIKMLFYIFYIRNAKVIVSCHKSGMPVLNLLAKTKIQKQVYYWAIGSGLMSWIKEGAISIKTCKYMKRIIAESPSMVKELEGMGLDNVEYMPNMKPVVNVKGDKTDDKVNFVFLSRILEEKGCFLITDVCKKLNAAGFLGNFTVSFYGDVSKAPEFLHLIEDLPNVKYKGILDLTSKLGYEELSSYSVFLFPTYYANEGFPGVLMDALMSGLPIIATDWKYNLDVVEDNYNGIVIKPKDEESLLTAMKGVITGKYNLEMMSENCFKSAKKYDVNNVLTGERLKDLKLL